MDQMVQVLVKTHHSRSTPLEFTESSTQLTP
nr:MAG TPA: hypothetical protein [Caudoviricetes sp.]